MAKLNYDELESLRDLIEHSGFRALLRELECLTEALEWDVVKCSSNDEKDLLRVKCRAEGARKLLQNAQRRFEQLKPRHEARV